MSYRNFTSAAIIAATLAAGSAHAQLGSITAAGMVAAGVHERAEQSTKGEAPAGDVVTLEFSKYQFVPSVGTMQQLCREAWEKTHPTIDFNLVHIKHGRNVLLGVSNCTMTAAKPEESK